jgi:RNA 3'-terminal phosphate cyclase (ATP)
MPSLNTIAPNENRRGRRKNPPDALIRSVFEPGRKEITVIEIDGSTYSGSGTLLRYAVALSTLIGEPVHMVRIRSRRDKPGLRPQHLQAVQACRDISGGRVEGAAVDSEELTYYPGRGIPGGDFHWEIGTAGSTTMIAFTLLPLGLFAGQPCRFSIVGGLFQDFAPSAYHMQYVLIPLLQRMGAEISLEIVRPGYVPTGRGHIILTVKPLPASLRFLSLMEQGQTKEIWGISSASHLEPANVAARMAEECKQLLQREGMEARVDVTNDRTAAQRGAAFFLRAETKTGCLLGADQAGKPGRRSEAIARFVVQALLEDLRAGATTDRHLADQLILFGALAEGLTRYVVPFPTDHINSNLWLINRFLGVDCGIEGNVITIRGAAFRKN